MIGLKPNRDGTTGVVYVRSTGTNQDGQVVLDYVRWVMVRKGDPSAQVAEAVLPDLPSAVPAADLVVPVPDSGVHAALGYAEASGIPFDFGLIRNHYVGRTFIEPKQSIRSFGVKVKLNPARELLRGKRVVLVDDSIVRGNTSGPIVRLLREAGAREVHMRVSSPPIRHPCFLGVDMASYPELLAHRMDIPEIQDFLGVDSLAYLSLEGLMRATGRQEAGFCQGCFNGHYPVDVSLLEKEMYEA